MTIDYYQVCEDALVVRLRTLTSFFKHDWQVTDDDADLNRGADYFALYRPGAFPNVPKNMREFDFSWNIPVRLHVKYYKYKTSWAMYRGLRSALINLLIPDFSLSGTLGVWRVTYSANEDPQYFWFDEPLPGVRPNFIIHDTVATITQRCSFEV